MSEYLVFASDLDETLLNKDHLIPKRNIDAIQKARTEYGIKFIPATGRGYSATGRELKQLGLTDLAGEYVLSYNGGCLTENKGNREIYFHALPYEKVCEIVNFAKDLDVCICIYTVKMIYMYHANDNERERKIGQGVDFCELPDLDLSFLKETPIAKIILQNLDMAYLHSIEPLLAPIFADCCSPTYSAGRYMEIVPAGVDKGKGLEKLSALLDIPLSKFIVAGDSSNDLPMLQKAGLAVCPSNATDEVKAICDYIAAADNNEGVIAEVMEKFIFRDRT